jgi:hypothetical protein
MNTTSLAALGLILIVGSSVGCSGGPPPAKISGGPASGRVHAQQSDMVAASALELALHCEQYEGRLVTTMGIGTLAFERQVLCPSEDLAYDSRPPDLPRLRNVRLRLA